MSEYSYNGGNATCNERALFLLLFDGSRTGVGYGQALATWFVVTYYCVLIAITLFYFFSSFQTILPWTVCALDWPSFSWCYNSSADTNVTDFNITGLKSSSDLYFK